ncbi:MAG TPA: tetratricopeptide repeat protein [Opitutaceae bacterium]|nr:tetratricopeptide repeat protein [Opitutaceae bacterium]
MAPKAEGAVRPRPRAARIAAALVVAAAAAASGWALWRRQIVVSSLPPVPAAADSELADQLGAAERDARSFLHPVRGLIRLSRLYHANGDYDQALQCYAALRRLQPGNARWPHLEASLLALDGRMDDAIPRERRAVELAPGYVPARLRLAQEYQKSNRGAEAKAEFGRVLARAKDDPYALLGIALCDIQEGDWYGAADPLRRAVAAHPDFVGAMSLMVTVYDHFGDGEHAEMLRQAIGRREFIDLEDPWLDELMDDCYDAYRISVVAAVQYFAGHAEAANALLRRCIRLEPQTAAYRRQYANDLFKEGDLPGAREQLEIAVGLQRDDSDAWLLLYQVEQAMRDLPAASATLLRALACCPKSASLHLERAHLLRAQGQAEEEARELHEAYLDDMRNGEPLEELALLYLGRRRVGDAVALLQEALARQPEDPHAIAMMTFCCIETGDEAGALRWWTDHVCRQPRVPAELKQALQKEYQQKFGRPLP